MKKSIYQLYVVSSKTYKSEKVYLIMISRNIWKYLFSIKFKQISVNSIKYGIYFVASFKMSYQPRKILLPLLPISTRPTRSPPLQPSLKLFMTRDLLYEYLTKIDYPSIEKICSMNKEICSTDKLIEDLIRKRRIEFKTDLLEQNPGIGFKLAEASKSGDVEVVDELISRGYDPSYKNDLPINLASEYGHLPVVERLLQDRRVDPSAINNFAIRMASYNGHLPVVERLLQDERVDPSADKNFAIENASENGYLPVVNRLLQDKRVDPSANKNHAVIWASNAGHLPIVRRLLQDIRVRKSLSPEYLQHFMKQVGYIFPPLSSNQLVQLE